MMQHKLNIACLQTNLIWENPEENRVLLQRKIETISTKVDLIILPEMFSTGFSMHAETLAETMNGETVTWLKKMAQNTNAALIGSLIISEENKFYNRLLFVQPNGKIDVYNKRHTFTLAGEDKIYTKGKNRLVVTYKGWRICPLVCYDLRFPVFSRNTENYDVLIYVANWPEQRIMAWNTLLKARAIENMSYCVGVNRIGEDAKNNVYSGHSVVLNALGETVAEATPYKDETFFARLEKLDLEATQNRLGFLKDKDVFTLK